MRAENTMDLGFVQMHKKVIGDIAVAAIKDIPGVSLAHFGVFSDLCEMLGYKNFPGVSVRAQKDGGSALHLRVSVEYGLNIPSIANRIQETVRNAIERSLEIDFVEINVNIQSVERREASCGS